MGGGVIPRAAFDASGHPANYYVSTVNTGPSAPQITDVVWLEANKSIAGTDPAAALSGSLAGRSYTLRIVGSRLFQGKKSASDFGIAFGPRVLNQTAIGPVPHNKVLIDGAIALTPVTEGVFTPETLTMRLDTVGVVDYFLKGTHHLTVVDGPQHQTVPIRFGEPESAVEALAPIVQSVEVIPRGNPVLKGIADDEEESVLLLTGQGFPLAFHRAWVQVDGQRAYLHGTQLLASSSRAFVHLPETFTRRPGSNQLLVASPFGATWTTF